MKIRPLFSFAGWIPGAFCVAAMATHPVFSQAAQPPVVLSRTAMEFQCPARMHVLQKVEPTTEEGWRVDGSDKSHPLVTVSFFAGPPEQKAKLVPSRQERQSGDGDLGVRTRRSALLGGLRIWRHIRHCGTRVTDRRRGLHRGIRSRFLRTRDEAVELPALQALRTGTVRRLHCLAAATRHTALPTSSATSSPPFASSATPTGRPRASPSPLTKPVSTSSGMPCGLPLANGTKMTL